MVVFPWEAGVVTAVAAVKLITVQDRATKVEVVAPTAGRQEVATVAETTTPNMAEMAVVVILHPLRTGYPLLLVPQASGTDCHLHPRQLIPTVTAVGMVGKAVTGEDTTKAMETVAATALHQLLVSTMEEEEEAAAVVVEAIRVRDTEATTTGATMEEAVAAGDTIADMATMAVVDIAVRTKGSWIWLGGFLGKA